MVPATTTAKTASLPKAATSLTTNVSGSSSDEVIPANVDKTDNIWICELLFFMFNNFDEHPPDTIKTVIADFYREDEIMAAKTMLIQVLPSDVKGPPTEKYVKRRIKTNKVKNSVDDILSLLELTDRNGLRDKD